MVAETHDATYYKTENDNAWVQYNKPEPTRQPKSVCQSIIKPEPTSRRKPRPAAVPAAAGNLGSYKFLCGICKKAFADKRHLNDHVMRHEGRQYKCEFCPKAFTGYRGLELHTPLHTGKYPFHCETCNSGFNYRRELEACQNKHLGKAFTCLKCNKVFYTEKDFQKHQEKCRVQGNYGKTF